MNLTKSQFILELDRKLSAIYSVFAEESIQIIEITDKIIEKAKSEGFHEKETHIVTKDIDWSILSSQNENLDLFASKKIIEIKLIGTGPGNSGSKALKEYCLSPDPNKLLLITAEGLQKKQQSSSWAKAVEEKGIFISEPPINKVTMPQWIINKAESMNLKIEIEAIQILCEKNEGNLDAAIQELMKLSLLFPDKKISSDDMIKSISDGSKYGIFDLSNVFLNGNKKKTIKIIESLKSEGVQPPLLLWALSKEIYNLYKVTEEGNTKNIWGPRHYLELLSKRANKLSKAKVKESLVDIAEIDSAIKGLSDKSPWQCIRELAIKF